MTRGFGRFLRHNTLAMLALFLALGGTTYAASTALIGKNTVASPQVVNGSLQTKDLSAKARKALKGNRGIRGPAGAAGVAGPKGATGQQGPVGPSAAYQNYINGNLAVSTSAATPTTINSLVLPGPGTYLVTATASLFDGATAPSNCDISSTITRNGAVVGDHAEVGTSLPAAGEYIGGNLSSERLLAVSGASQTIAVTAYRNHGTGTCTVFNRSLTATLVGSGVGTLSASKIADAAAQSGPTGK